MVVTQGPSPPGSGVRAKVKTDAGSVGHVADAAIIGIFCLPHVLSSIRKQDPVRSRILSDSNFAGAAEAFTNPAGRVSSEQVSGLPAAPSADWWLAERRGRLRGTRWKSGSRLLRSFRQQVSTSSSESHACGFRRNRPALDRKDSGICPPGICVIRTR